MNQSPYDLGPAGSIDNGDGTYTFNYNDGRDPWTAAGQFAQQTHEGLQNGDPLVQPSPDLLAAAAPGPDMRTAGLGDDLWQGAKSLGGRVADSMAQSRAEQARLGNFSGIHNTDMQSAADAGVPVPGAAPEPPPPAGTRTGTTEVSPAHIDPGALSFGGAGMGGGLQSTRTYVPGTKGGWTPGTKEERPGFQASEALQTARQAGQGLELDAADKEYEANKQMVAVNAAAAAGREDALKSAMAEDQAKQQQQADEVRARMAKIDALGNDIAAQKIDPDQLFKQVGALGDIGFALAAAAGQYATGITGAPNAALNTINGMVERNIGAQSANLANRKEGLQAQKGALGILQGQFATENEARAAHRVLMWKAVDAQVDKEKAALGDAFNDAAYAKVKADVQGKITAGMEQAEKEAWTQTSIRSGYAKPTSGGYVDSGFVPDKIDLKTVVTDPTGKHMALSTEDGAKEYRKQAADVHVFNGMIDRYEALRAKWANRVVPSAAKGEMDNLEAGIAQAAPKTLHGQSRFTDLEKEASNSGKGLFGTPGAMQALRETADATLAQAAHENQGIPVQRGFSRDKTGARALGYRFAGTSDYGSGPRVTPRGDPNAPPPSPVYGAPLPAIVDNGIPSGAPAAQRHKKR